MANHMQFGNEPGQPRLGAGGAAPALGSGKEVLPALEEAVAIARPMWRHPAFIVASILTLLTLIAAGVLTAISMLGSGSGSVSDASIAVTSGNAHLTWQASGPVELYAVTSSEPLDLTQLVAGDGEAWIPAALGLYNESSCFVIRPASANGDPVALDGDTLAEQRAASVCVRDSSAESE